MAKRDGGLGWNLVGALARFEPVNLIVQRPRRAPCAGLASAGRPIGPAHGRTLLNNEGGKRKFAGSAAHVRIAPKVVIRGTSR